MARRRSTAKARTLTYWLRRNIRYVSAGEKHDYTPHPPWQVYTNRFGDCKDTSQMLAVMLRETGILCVYGSGFGMPAEAGSFRIVYLADPSELRPIYADIADFTHQYLLQA